MHYADSFFIKTGYGLISYSNVQYLKQRHYLLAKKVHTISFIKQVVHSCDHVSFEFIYLFNAQNAYLMSDGMSTEEIRY